MKMLSLLFSMTLIFSSVARADDSGPSMWKRNTAITLFSAVGGGILGLSTLSFYGNPQDHTSNVSTGVVLGLAAGIGYVIWENNQQEQGSSWGLNFVGRQPVVAYEYRF